MPRSGSASRSGISAREVEQPALLGQQRLASELAARAPIAGAGIVAARCGSAPRTVPGCEVRDRAPSRGQRRAAAGRSRAGGDRDGRRAATFARSRLSRSAVLQPRSRPLVTPSDAPTHSSTSARQPAGRTARAGCPRSGRPAARRSQRRSSPRRSRATRRAPASSLTRDEVAAHHSVSASSRQPGSPTGFASVASSRE